MTSTISYIGEYTFGVERPALGTMDLMRAMAYMSKGVEMIHQYETRNPYVQETISTVPRHYRIHRGRLQAYWRINGYRGWYPAEITEFMRDGGWSIATNPISRRRDRKQAKKLRRSHGR